MLLPAKYQIKSAVQETHDVFTLTLSPLKEKIPAFLPGQFHMLYLFGLGEIPISTSGDPSKKDELVYTIRSVGAVTRAMQGLKKGDEIGVRGPFGTYWPLSQNDCDVLMIAGGLGLAPLRPAIYYLASHRKQFKKITLLYGTRTPDDILFKDEWQQWKNQGFDIEISMDRADPRWSGYVGFVTALIRPRLTHPENTIVLACGPEVMMKNAVKELQSAKVDERAIHLSMERNMQCAIGCCGHCQFGPFFVCKDGPVFSLDRIKSWLAIKEL
jgi:NAD(P)H-flavin reductase